MAPGVPSDGARDVPDVSLASATHNSYIIIKDHVQGSNTFSGSGGTSASTPAFAGLMALIVQKTGQRQGNPNPRLYQLGAAQYGVGGPAVFHDVTVGNNTVPGQAGFSCATGYDQATGLGSVDATALANNWASSGGGTVTIFSDNFAGSFPGQWHLSFSSRSGTDTNISWGKSTYRTTGSSASIWCAGGGSEAQPPGGTYLPNMGTFAIYGPFLPAGATAATLDFDLWLNSETNYDFMNWVISVDGSHFYGYQTSGNTGGWTHKTLNFADVTQIAGGRSVERLGRAPVHLRLEQSVRRRVRRQRGDREDDAGGVVQLLVVVIVAVVSERRRDRLGGCDGPLGQRLLVVGDQQRVGLAARDERGERDGERDGGILGGRQQRERPGGDPDGRGADVHGQPVGRDRVVRVLVLAARDQPRVGRGRDGVAQRRWGAQPVGFDGQRRVRALHRERHRGSDEHDTGERAGGVHRPGGPVGGDERIRSPEGALDAAVARDVRTYNLQPSGWTYGQGYDGIASTDALQAGGTAWLPQLAQSGVAGQAGTSRVNIGITNTGSAAASVTLTLYDGNGTQVWTDTRTYAAGQFYQYQEPYRTGAGRTDIAAGYATITVNSGSGIIAYASDIDNGSGDPTTVNMKQ